MVNAYLPAEVCPACDGSKWIMVTEITTDCAEDHLIQNPESKSDLT